MNTTQPHIVAPPETNHPHDLGAPQGDVLTLDILNPQVMAASHATYDARREAGHVSQLTSGASEPDSHDPRDKFFNRSIHVVPHYDDAVATLLDNQLSSDLRALANNARIEGQEDQGGQEGHQEEFPEEFRPLARSIITLDPPDHTRIRKLVQPSFTGRGMEAMRPAIQQVVDDLLDRAEQEAAARGEAPGTRRMGLIREFAYPFPVAVISDLLGIPRDDREQVKGWTEHLLRVDRGGDAGLDEQVRQGLLDFTAYLKDLFGRKRRTPTDDMISRLVLIEDDRDTLTEEETLATVLVMYLAGHVTTVNLVGSGVMAMLSHPEQFARLREHPSLVRNMVEETLRFWGPVDFIGRRTAVEDMEIAGTPIAAGDQVAVGLASANRDPARFTNPDVFDITRTDANRHIAFGKGIHACLGAPLACVEAQVAFETLVRRYPELRLALPAEEIPWSGSALRGFRHVSLIF